jgi:hypothetical protein
MLKQHRTYVSNYFAWRLTPGLSPAPSQVKSSPPAPMLLACSVPGSCLWWSRPVGRSGARARHAESTARAAWLQGCADSTMRTREQAEHWGRKSPAGNCMYHSTGCTCSMSICVRSPPKGRNKCWPVHAAVHGETQYSISPCFSERCYVCRTFSDERAGSHSHSDRSRPARRADGTAHQWATPRPKKSRRHSCRLGVFSKRLA